MAEPGNEAPTPEVSLGEAKALASPTPLLLTAIASAAFAGFVWHPRAYVIGVVLVVLLAWGLAMPIASTRLLSVSAVARRGRSRVGEPTGIRLTVEGARWVNLRGLSFEPGPAANWRAPDLAALVVLRRGESRELDWLVTPTRRGAFLNGTIEASCSAPFRAFTSRRRLAIESPAIAWPEVIDANPAENRGDSGLGSTQRSELGGVDGELSGPRPYRPGESARRIHWPQSLRRDQLIVCDREVQEEAAVSLTLNLPTDSEVSEAATEAAVSVLASLATACARRPGGVLVEVPGAGTYRCRDARSLAPLMDQLAMVQPFAGGASGGSFEKASHAVDRSICVTTQTDAAANHASTGPRLVVVDRSRPQEPALGPGDRVLSVANWRKELPAMWESLIG